MGACTDERLEKVKGSTAHGRIFPVSAPTYAKSLRYGAISRLHGRLRPIRPTPH